MKPSVFIACLGAVAHAAYAAVAKPYIKADGRHLVDPHGDKITLKGVNLGSHFLLENWMSPLDVDSNTTMGTAMEILNKRFGVEKQEELVKTYQETWFTEADMQRIANQGLNLLRVPIWYGQFIRLSNLDASGWRDDAFEELDRIVNLASKYGIYIVLDMHGAFGAQSTSQTTGYTDKNQYWKNEEDRDKTIWLWKKVAEHYVGNPTIAGYDILNEPFSVQLDITREQVLNEYDRIYKALRSVDPERLIIMEDCFRLWQMFELDDPKNRGWTNVMYESHPYLQGSFRTEFWSVLYQTITEAYSQLFYEWNVPRYIGEFTGYGSQDVYRYARKIYGDNGVSWSVWSYKSIDRATENSSWGWYKAKPDIPAKPDLRKDTFDDIKKSWQLWKTEDSFEQDPILFN